MLFAIGKVEEREIYIYISYGRRFPAVEKEGIGSGFLCLQSFFARDRLRELLPRILYA
jgi:hypothetical protein